MLCHQCQSSCVLAYDIITVPVNLKNEEVFIMR